MKIWLRGRNNCEAERKRKKGKVKERGGERERREK